MTVSSKKKHKTYLSRNIKIQFMCSSRDKSSTKSCWYDMKMVLRFSSLHVATIIAIFCSNTLITKNSDTSCLVP